MMSIPAVQVVNASKAYGTERNIVLNNLNMRVNQGTIYCLLGASGCGKTTLLSCIVGMKHLDNGEVKVFGVEPGKAGIVGNNIGYMPQDIALYEIFTIKEILSYFGQIYGMTKGEIRTRIQFLSNFLCLPDTSNYIKDLSGGQKRLISYAISMIHEARLLILDEPTVGVDPLLREKIWTHLNEMVTRTGTTVIVSTHYIQEACQSHMVGLMRHGRLLSENHPHALMKQYNSDLLEDVVLKLCRSDTFLVAKNNNLPEDKSNCSTELSQIFVQTQRVHNNEKDKILGLKYQRRKSDFTTSTTTGIPMHIPQTESITKRTTNHAFSEYNKISSLLKRNFLMHFRQPVFVIVQLIIPTLQIIIFNYIMGSEPYGLKIAVVNNEIPMQSDNQTYLDVCSRVGRMNSCFGEGLSCSYFKMFEKDQVDWIPVQSDYDAMQSVRNGKTTGFITIPSDFGKQMQNKLLQKQFASNESLIGSTISIHLDFSNKLSSSYLIKEFHERFLLFVQDIVKECGGDPRFVTLPLKFNAIYGSLRGRWSEFFQPAFVLWIIFLLPMAVGILYVSDVKAGTMDRTLIAGVQYRHLLISILICEGVMTFLQLGLCFIVLLFGFNFHVVGSLSLCIFLCFLMGMIGVTLGLLIGTICKHEMEVIMVAASIYMITVPASGGVWPLACITPWYRIVSYMVPVTVPLESIRSVVNRNWGLEHPRVWDGLLVMLGWISVCCILSAIFHRLRN